MDAAQVPTSTISCALLHANIATTARYLDRLASARNIKAAVDKVFN